MAWAKTVSAVSLSVVTVEEIFFGLTWKPNPKIQAWFEKIQAWFEGFLRTHCHIYVVSDEIARCAGRLRGALAAQGQTRSQADMLIAATAQVHQQMLVTRNVRDFEGCGIALFNPFS